MNRIIKLFIKPSYKKKVIPIINDIENPIRIQLSDKKYYTLIQNIRNMQKISEEEMIYIKTFPQSNLLDIIEIYDSNVETLNILFNNDFK